MNHLQVLQNARRVLRIRQLSLPSVLVRFTSDSPAQPDRPWDKSTRAVVFELPDVTSPAELKSRQLPGIDSHSSQVFEPKTDKNIAKVRTAGAHFDLSFQNWERNQNKDFRSRMKQWDMDTQASKASRSAKYREYGTFESNRGNISGRPGLSNSAPMTLHQFAKSKQASTPNITQHDSSKKSSH